jgi:radical SAM superfamily enzyme YgiQ (UPF0313 family)
MKVLLVRPVDKQIEKVEMWPLLGLGYLATALRKNHSVEILDCPKEKMTYEQFAGYIKINNPDVIGFSFISVSLEPTKECIRIVKEINPKIVIIVGGPHVSGVPEDTFEFLKEADFGFQGEADRGLPLLLDRLSSGALHNLSEIPGLIWRNNSKIIVNPPEFIENLDSLGFPSWDLIRPDSYVRSFYLHPHIPPEILEENNFSAPISVTRGCPYNCIFCGCGSVAGKVFRKPSITHIISEIKLLYDVYGVRMFMVIDDNIGFNNKFLKEFCLNLVNLGLYIKWNIPLGLRLDNLDEETLRLMDKSGCCYFSVGIESGSQRILNLMKKGTTLQMIREKISLVKKTTRIKVGGLFVLGYPSETKEEVKSTIHFARELNLDTAHFFLFAPAPGSELWDSFKKSGKLDQFDWSRGWGKAFAIPPDSISIKELKKLYIHAYLGFYLRPKIIFNLLRYPPSFILKYIAQSKLLLIDFLR